MIRQSTVWRDVAIGSAAVAVVGGTVYGVKKRPGVALGVVAVGVVAACVALGLQFRAESGA